MDTTEETETETPEKPKKPRGFATMSPEKRAEIAKKGGVEAHRRGTAHRWNSKQATDAGRKGGAASHANRGTTPDPTEET